MKNTTDHKSMEQTTTPKLSIIIPAYNVETFLPKCLDSVLAQNFTDWEAIIVDDGSTDGTGAICNDYAARDPRFKVIHSPNKGVASARNIGLDNATGEFLGAIDSDDWIEPDMYSTLFSFAERNNADIVKCTMRLVYKNRTANERSFSKVLVADRDEALRLACDNRILTSSMCDKIIRRSLFTVKFAANKIYEDYRIIIPLIANSNKTVVIPDALYNYRMREGSIVHDISLYNIRQFVDAEQERLHSLLSLQIAKLNDSDKYIPYYRTIVKFSRDAARRCSGNPEYHDFINEMRSKLSGATFKHMAKLGLKNGLRLLKLKYSTEWFIISVNTKSYFRIGKHRKDALYHN